MTIQRTRTTDPGRVFVTSIPAGVAVYRELEVTDELQEWKALYNFHCSPFHPFIKAIFECVWAHRDWDTFTSCPSQSTIGTECGFSRTTVKKYVSIAHGLGLFGITTMGATEFQSNYPALAKFAKSKQQYSIYAFDLTADIWQQPWTREELAVKNPAAVLSTGSRRRPVSRDAHGKLNGSSPRPINGSSPRPVNGSPLSAETFSFPSRRAEQVVTPRRNLDGARSSSSNELDWQADDIDQLLEDLE